MTEAQAFGEALRQALNHLFDTELGANPLVHRLGLEMHDDPAQALRTLLRQAIEAFRPASDAPSDSRSWRRYQILLGRYIDRLTQDAVAAHLGITTRHLRREQSAALQALEDYLKLRYDLPLGASPDLGHESASLDQSEVELNREMLWLADSLRDRTSEVEPILRKVLELTKAFAQQHAASLSLSCAEALPSAAVPPTVLQQIVLNLVTATMRNLAPKGWVRLFAQVERGRLVILLTATVGRYHSWQSLATLDTSVGMSRRLTELFQGELTLSEIGDLLVARITLPTAERRVTVLAVEDNLDTLQLWQRYVQGTFFSLVEETDPQQAVTRAAALRPDLILLDVMLPNIDGWELLRQLRNNPLTASIPVIICTVLPQKELALSLGASDFIQKPATGREFRAVLERQSVAAEPPQSPQPSG